MESNYKNLTYDWKNVIEKTQDILPESIDVPDEHSTKFRGTKGLMSLVQGYMDDAKTPKLDDPYEDLTNPE